MRTLIDRALERYAQSDYHLQMKVRFFFGTCLFLIVIVPFVIFYSSYFQLHDPSAGLRLDLHLLVPELFSFVIAVTALIFLVRGHFSIAAHMILMGTLIVIWTVMFFERSHILSRLDTIVLCVGLLSMTPLVVSRRIWAIPFYGMLNILFLFGYITFYRHQLGLTDSLLIEYLSENTLTIVFVSFTAFCVFSINNKALEQAAADIREREAAELIVRSQKVELEDINEELSVTVDKMAATTREYEEANVRLTEAQQEILSANARLRESEEKFSKAFHLSPLMICLVSYPEGRFVDVSDTFCYTMEFRREEIIARTSQELGLWENPMDFETIKDLLKCDMNVLDEEFSFRTKNGRLQTVLVSAEVISIAQVPHIILVGIDITERKQAEEEKSVLEAQLRQSQKMESIGRLAGGVAHDFNNLLTAILGNTDLALMELAPETPLHSRLKVVLKAAESAADLTRQLLAFSRKQIIEPQPIDLAALLENMQKMLARLIGEDIRLEITTPQHLGMIKADAGQIEQIIVNLAVNARDAMPEGGRLFLEVADTVLDEDYVRLHPYTKPGEYVMLIVSDTGSGMSADVKQHLFEPFFTTKPQGKGTGLGLATIYGAVKQHSGSIEVYSELDHGTTFKIYFPRLLEKAKPVPQPFESLELPIGIETILLVEDDLGVLDFSLGFLQQLGYTVLAAENGEAALALAQRYAGQIHLLLTDVIMPGINGRILADHLVSERPSIRVLFSSGYTENVIVHHGVLEQGINFIGKPYTAPVLARKVREVLDNDKRA